MNQGAPVSGLNSSLGACISGGVAADQDTVSPRENPGAVICAGIAVGQCPPVPYGDPSTVIVKSAILYHPKTARNNASRGTVGN